jgi:hypothetical protein
MFLSNDGPPASLPPKALEILLLSVQIGTELTSKKRLQSVLALGDRAHSWRILQISVG